MNISLINEVSTRLKQNMQTVIRGKDAELDTIILAILCGGHVLLEDLPGTGKTTSAKALAASLGATFKRVQFTPDLLPTDLVGLNIYNQKCQDFIFKPGPVFTNILLADEINRATPRTQSSLLDCMEAHQVTIDGETHLLEPPFLVIATQNPIETQGTFPLPEAQLDRFFIRRSFGYPSTEEEFNILTTHAKESPLHTLKACVTKAQLLEAQANVKDIVVSNALKS